MECRGFESHPRQLIFSRKSDCLGCAVLLCLVCLFDLACFFLSSFSSLIKHMYKLVRLVLYTSCSLHSHADSGQDSKSEATGCTVAEQLSSISDSTSSTGDSGVHHRYIQ